jgi:hypothetical protein
MADKGVRIRIVSESVGKGFKDTNKALAGLKKAVGALGLSVTGAAILKFGKDAAKAFIEDEKAASRLAQSVKNLGLAFETPRIEQFISELSKASGVTDDQLRPAMQKLLQTTGSVAKSTELLTQALDISRGSGVDYETVVNDLSLAYVGQTRGLKKYSLGLSQAELKTMSFADVQDKLNKQFQGANAQYLTTYAGKMELLSTAAGEAQETIGKGLVDALSLLAGEGNTVQPLADSMADFSTYVSDAIVGVAVLIDKINKIPGVGSSNPVSKGSFAMFPSLGSLAILKKGLDYVSKTGAEYQAMMNPITQGYLGSMPIGIYPTSAELAKQRQAEAERIKREKELAALQKKSLDAQKKTLALQKASKTINLDAIGIEAALKGKISETDRLSLQLQKAILDGNATLATSISDQLDAAIKRNNELRLALLATPKAPNPFSEWSVPKLDFGGNMLGTPVPNFTPPSFVTPGMFDTGGSMGPQAFNPPTPKIEVKVEVGGQDVAAIITQQQTNQSLSGSFVSVNRGGRFATRPDEG